MALTKRPEKIVQDSNNELLSIHPSWNRITLGEVSSITNGFAFKSNLFSTKSQSGIPLVRIRDITNNESTTYYAGEYDEKYLIFSGDILVGMDGDFKSAIWGGSKSLLNQRVCKISVDEKKYNKKFFFYVLQPYLDAINAETSSVTVKHLSSKSLSEIPLPQPPLEAQKIIADKIDELYGKIDRGTSKTQLALNKIEDYKKLILNSYTLGNYRGELYNEEINGDLPVGWKWTELSSIGEVSGGLTKSKKRESYKLHIPYLRVANVYSNELKLDDVHNIGVSDAELPRVLLQNNDLLIVEGNGSADQIGRMALWDDSIRPCAHQNHIIKVRINKPQLSMFIIYWFMSPKGREQIERDSSSTSGLYTLSISKISKFLVPLPPLNEAIEISEIIKEKIFRIEKIKEKLNEKKLLSIKLKREILKKAVTGNLISGAALYEIKKKKEKDLIHEAEPEKKMKQIEIIEDKGEVKDMKTLNLCDILSELGKMTTVEDLFSRSKYQETLSIFSIEEFYEELKFFVDSGRIEFLRSENGDFLIYKDKI